MALQIPNSPCESLVKKCLETSTTRLGWGTFALPWVDSLARQSAISVELALHCSPEGGGELTQFFWEVVNPPWGGRFPIQMGVIGLHFNPTIFFQNFSSCQGVQLMSEMEPFDQLSPRSQQRWGIGQLLIKLGTCIIELWSMLDIDKWCYTWPCTSSNCIYCRVALLPLLVCNNWSTFLCHDQVCSGEVSRCLWGCRETCRGDTKQ